MIHLTETGRSSKNKQDNLRVIQTPPSMLSCGIYNLFRLSSDVIVINQHFQKLKLLGEAHEWLYYNLQL